MNKMTRLHFILIAVIVAVIAAGVFFFFRYQKAEASQPDLQDEITLALMRLETVKDESDLTELKQELADKQQTLKLLTREEPLFPEEPLIVEVGGLIVDARHKLDLTLLKLKSDEDADTVTVENPDPEGEDNKYNVAQFEVEVMGDLGRIVSLIGEIEGSDITTLTIEDLELTYEEEYDEETGKVTSYWLGIFNVITLYEYQEED